MRHVAAQTPARRPRPSATPYPSLIASGTPHQPLSWVRVSPGAPYFETEDGQPWHPIGQNDAISWTELGPLFRRKDVAAVERYLSLLSSHGVTCMRLMLEYAQVRHRYFETGVGQWAPNMVRYWDDLFTLAEQHGIRILLTPFDTFWMWLHFRHHPYNQGNGGPLHAPSSTLLSRSTRDAIKARLTFAAERWGGSGALFAWDLWNEIHPAQAEMSSAPFHEFIEELSSHVRSVEQRAFGKSHPQTVSLFGPELDWRPDLAMEAPLFRHPSLDFATIHIYQHGTIDDPKNTVDAAVDMGEIVRRSLTEITDGRPFLDTEHGPIHTFKDRRKTLPAAFDDEYFRHMQWAHLSSGGAGGGMRWPNRRPHSLTPGMRVAQRGLAAFLPLLDWSRFRRTNVSSQLQLVNDRGTAHPAKRIARFGCSTDRQALLYLLRKDAVLKSSGLLDRNAQPLSVTVKVPQLTPGSYRVTTWNTVTGVELGSTQQVLGTEGALALPPLAGDFAVAIRRT